VGLVSRRKVNRSKSGLPIVKNLTANNATRKTVSQRIKNPPVTGTMMGLSGEMNAMLVIVDGMIHENHDMNDRGIRTTREDYLGSHPPVLPASEATRKENVNAKPRGGAQIGEMGGRVAIPKIVRRKNHRGNQTTVGTNARGQEERENPKAEEDLGSMKETGHQIRKIAELDQGMGKLL
jgi:hypothetical protein